jgi:hypothetical protein
MNERPNIRRMQIQESQKKQLEAFDTHKNLPGVEEYLRDTLYNRGTDWQRINDTIWHAEMLFPDLLANMPMPKRIEMWNDLKEELDRLRQGPDNVWGAIGKLGCVLNFLDPVRVDELKLGPEVLEGITRYLRRYVGSSFNSDSMRAYESASYTRILFAEVAKNHPEMNKLFERGALLLRETQSTTWYCKGAANLRLMFPERFPELKIDTNNINGVRGLFPLKTDWQQFHPMGRSPGDQKMQMAEDLVILTAHDVSISKAGLRIQRNRLLGSDNANDMPAQLEM